MRSDYREKRMRRIQLRVAHLGGLAKLMNIREYGAESLKLPSGGFPCGKFPSGGNLTGGPVRVGYGGKNEQVTRMEQVTIRRARPAEGS